MKGTFEEDPYPGKPRILFIGLSESTHTHSWIDLLDRAELNVRLFAVPTHVPPEHWRVKTYVTAWKACKPDPDVRSLLRHPASPVHRLGKQLFAKLVLGDGTPRLAERWLAEVIRAWRPDVIHTLGLDPAGYFYFGARGTYGLQGIGKWVLQLRGGSDLTLSRLDPALVPKIRQVLLSCDQLLSDNEQNFAFARELGLREEQISPLRTVPGTGGIDVDAISRAWRGRTSSRRRILWPKAYDCVWSKALPVFEALKMCWDAIRPCEIDMLAMDTAETKMWFKTLPTALRDACRVERRIPRKEALELMVQARVALAPSLIDGTPNTLFEAMAAGAMPIVSPLETIMPIVEDERNVLFARNLYPHEIADALCRAMSDDRLVDQVAEKNLAHVRKLADRTTIGPRVVGFYETLARLPAF